MMETALVNSTTAYFRSGVASVGGQALPQTKLSMISLPRDTRALNTRPLALITIPRKHPSENQSPSQNTSPAPLSTQRILWPKKMEAPQSNLSSPQREIMKGIQNLLEVIRGRQPGIDSVKAKKLKRKFARELSLYFRQLSRNIPYKDLPGYVDRHTVKEALTPDDEALRIASEVTEAMNQRLDSILRRNIEAGYLQGAIQAHQIVRIEPTFALIDDGAVQWMNSRAATMVTKINETTRQELARVLTKGTQAGDSVARIARNIRKEVVGWSDIRIGTKVRGRAFMIANTELNEAMSEASQQTYDRLGIAGKSWSTVGDDRVSDDCLDNEGAGIIPMGASFPGGVMHPPQHPDCRCSLVPEAEI